MKKALDLIVFDMDGTLYSTDERLDRVYPEAALRVLQRRKGWPRAEAERNLALRHRELCEQFGCRTTNTRVLLQCFEEIAFEEFEAEVDGLLPVEASLGPDPGVVEAVTHVCRAYPTFIFTLNSERVAERILRAIGLSALFPRERRFTVTHAVRLPLPRQEQLEYLKPAARGFVRVLEQNRAASERSLMVGDSESSDLRPASALGMHTYRVSGPADLCALPAWLGLNGAPA